MLWLENEYDECISSVIGDVRLDLCLFAFLALFLDASQKVSSELKTLHLKLQIKAEFSKTVLQTNDVILAFKNDKMWG